MLFCERSKSEIFKWQLPHGNHQTDSLIKFKTTADKKLHLNHSSFSKMTEGFYRHLDQGNYVYEHIGLRNKAPNGADMVCDE